MHVAIVNGLGRNATAADTVATVMLCEFCVDTAAIVTSPGFIVIVAILAAAVGGGVVGVDGGSIRRR